MTSEKIPLGVWLQAGILLVAVGASHQSNSSSIDALMVGHADHEARLRTIEKDFLVAFGELKGEFQSVKTRLTAIEKAVKP